MCVCVYVCVCVCEKERERERERGQWPIRCHICPAIWPFQCLLLATMMSLHVFVHWIVIASDLSIWLFRSLLSSVFVHHRIVKRGLLMFQTWHFSWIARFNTERKGTICWQNGLTRWCTRYIKFSACRTGKRRRRTYMQLVFGFFIIVIADMVGAFE